MLKTNLIILVALTSFFIFVENARQPITKKKSKLCGDPFCGEVLFKSRVKRVIGINNDPSFLKLTENAIIDVLAVKFSDRPDIMEGKLADGTRGFFYGNALDVAPYVEFLRSAIDNKKEMQMISQDPADTGDQKILGIVHSETDLIRDYNKRATEYAREEGLPIPEPLPIPEENHGGHGHSHGGHGHSHGGHGHSHGGHGHSHGEHGHRDTVSAKTTQSPAADAVGNKKSEIPVDDNTHGKSLKIQSAEDVKEKDAKDTIEEEIDRLIKLDEEKLRKEKEQMLAEQNIEIQNSVQDNVEVTLHPLELESITKTPPVDNNIPIPAHDIPITTTPIPNSQANVESQATEPNVVVTTPAPIKQPTPQPHSSEYPVDHKTPTSIEQPTPQSEATEPNVVVTTPAPIKQPTPQPPSSEHPVDHKTPTSIEQPTPQSEATEPNVVVTTPAPIKQPTPQPHSSEHPVDHKTPTSIDQPTPESEATESNVVVTTPAPITPQSRAPEKSIGSRMEEAVAESGVETSVEFSKGTCYKDECEGLQTPEPQTSDVQREEEELQKWETQRKENIESVKRYGDLDGRFKDAETNFSRDSQKEPTSSSRIIEFIRSSFGLGNITDASVVFYVNITFVLASLILFLIVHTLSNSSELDKFDRMAYFNLITKHKELEMQLKAKHSEIENLHRNGVHQQQQVSVANDQEIVALRHQIQQLQNEIQLTQAQKDEFEMHCNQWRDSSNEKQTEIDRLVGVMNELEGKLEKASLGGQDSIRELDSMRSQLTESHQVVLARQQELVDLRQEKDNAINRVDDLSQEIRGLNYQIEQLENSLHEHEMELKKVKNENSNLADMIQQYEKNKDEGGSAAESGGSGWSDFGDNDEFEIENKSEKTPDASQSGISAKDMEDIKSQYKKYGENLEEMALLKKKLVDVEKELTKYKSLYEKEERLKGDRDSKVMNLERDVADGKRKIDELEAEKKESADRMNELLKVLNASMTKSADVDKLVANLRDEGIAKEKLLMEAEGACRKKDDKIREVESELKRLQREYTKLETKSFHDVIQLKKKLDDLQTSQILSGSQMPLAPRDIFNSSDIGASDVNDRRIGMGSPLDEPIWDEPEYPPRQQVPQENYFSSDSMGAPKRRSSRRSDHRQLGETSPSDREEKTKSKKEVSHRRRSRSHGRNPQLYPDPFSAGYLPGSSDSSFMSHGFLPLTGRHSKSGQLHYSSGGSNGGRSPPPEMPLLSAIPPPGVRRMPAKRVD